ncbi:MAG: OFA family MFS transporter [Acidobacteria bacterium]|nr:OFA family MFS transporter [Acidobacteriota bacterium]
MPGVTPNRWKLAAAAILMQVCLGILYSWSVFRGPLSELYGWDKTVTIAPYRWSILFFTLAMIVAGFWQDRVGPRRVGAVGGFLLGTGCLLAAFLGDTPLGLNVSYGLVGGLGVGFAYVTPIATCVKWFPDKRGLVVGLAVMGFGVGSLIFAPLLEALIGSDPARYAETIPRTFLILAAVFYVLVIGSAQFFRVPPPGWLPAGWTPPRAKKGREDYLPGEMLATPSFWIAWLAYFMGSAVGLTAIGESAPLVRELAGSTAVMSGGMALGVMSLFNGIGRLMWGVVSDKLGRQGALFGMGMIALLVCALVMPGAANFWRVLIGICLVGFCYGGYLAVMPTLAADYFGQKNIGANYGLLFSAWGAAGFIVPGYLSGIIEQARQAGNIAQGYDQVFYWLAGIAGVAAGMALIARRPASER